MCALFASDARLVAVFATCYGHEELHLPVFLTKQVILTLIVTVIGEAQ